MKRMSILTLLIFVLSSLFSSNIFALQISSEDEFDQVVQQNSQVVVYFFFKMRPTTQELINVLNEIEKDFSKVVFVTVESRSSRNLALKHDAFLPYDVLALVKDGQEVKREFFYPHMIINKDEISSFINEAFPCTVCAAEAEENEVDEAEE